MPLLPGAEPFLFEGGRTGVLLVHGFTGCPQSMRPWGGHLAAAGLTVLCPRLPGHGTRWQDLNLTRWEDWYAEAEQCLAALAARSDEVFVMGLSMGGCLALRLAEQHPGEVAGLVLVNPAVLTLAKAARLVPLLKVVLPAYKAVSGDVKKEGVTELAYDRTPLKALASLTALWTLTRRDLGAVHAPLLVFRSAEDHIVEPANTAAVLAGVGSVDKEERVLANSYHVATLDNDAPEIFAGSVDFVRRHSLQGPRPAAAR